MFGILTVAIVVYVALISLLTALPARKRHWSMVLTRTGVIIASALVSIPLSKMIAAEIGDALYAWIQPQFGRELQKFLGDVPLVAESARLIVGLLLVPLLFLIVFLVLRAVLCLAIWIVERVVPALRKRSVRNSLIAMPIGAVNGILIALVTLIPLCGYLAMGSDALSAYQFLEEQGTPIPTENVMAPASDHIGVEPLSQQVSTDQGTLIEVMESIGDNTVIKVMNDLGLPLFEEMTSGTLKNGTIEFSLTKELPHLTDSVMLLMEAGGRIADDDITNEDTDALVSAVRMLLSSDWVAEVAADSIGFIAESWKEDESFMGMESPEMGTMLQPVLDTALTVLSTESVDTLRADVETVLLVMADLMTAGFLKEELNYDLLMEELGKDGLIGKIMNTLNANPHLSPLAEEIKTVSVKVVSSVLGEALVVTEEYDPLIADVAIQLNDVVHMSKEERDPVVRDAIKTAFADYDINVPEDIAVEFSEKALDEVGKDGTVDAEELKQYLIEHIDEGMDLTDGAFGN